MPERRDDVARHVSRDLDPVALDLFEVPVDESNPESSHIVLHRRLSGVVRSLRTRLDGIPLHAAACATPHRGLLLVGNTGSGKSTLVLMLALRRGAEVVSDDTVWIDGRTARGVGMPLAIRASSPLASEAAELWYAEPGERVLVLPDDLGAAPLRARCDVDTIVFPRFGGAPETVELHAADAFCRLTESVLRPCTNDELLDLAVLVSEVPTFAITYADTEQSLACVDDVLASASTAVDVRPRLLESAERDAAALAPDVAALRFGDERVALVSRATGTTVLLAGWPAGEPLGDDVADQLAAMAFAAPRSRS